MNRLILSALVFTLFLCIGCGEEEIACKKGEFPPASFSVIINDKKGNCLLPEIPEGFREVALEYYSKTYEINGIKQHIIDLEPNRHLKVHADEALGAGRRSLSLFTAAFNITIAKFVKTHKKEVCHIKVILMCPDIFGNEEVHDIEVDIRYSGDYSDYLYEYVENSVTIDGIPAEYVSKGTYKVNLNI